jgi:transcriptional regulator
VAHCLDQEFAGKMLAGIVELELEVQERACKLKLNQHRPEADASMHAMYAAGSENVRELAAWMERPGIGGRGCAESSA